MGLVIRSIYSLGIIGGNYRFINQVRFSLGIISSNYKCIDQVKVISGISISSVINFFFPPYYYFLSIYLFLFSLTLFTFFHPIFFIFFLLFSLSLTSIFLFPSIYLFFLLRHFCNFHFFPLRFFIYLLLSLFSLFPYFPFFLFTLFHPYTLLFNPSYLLIPPPYFLPLARVSSSPAVLSVHRSARRSEAPPPAQGPPPAQSLAPRGWRRCFRTRNTRPRQMPSGPSAGCCPRELCLTCPGGGREGGTGRGWGGELVFKGEKIIIKL